MLTIGPVQTSWNQWSTVSADGTATNNSLKCLNQVWISQVGPHPIIGKVIDAFIKTESESRRICIKIQEGRRELWPIINLLSYLLNSSA